MNSLNIELDKLKIAVIGDVMLDRYVWGEATRISPEAPVPVVRLERETCTAGAAANVALNLRAMGAGAILCGWTGGGEHGECLRGLLHDHGVETWPKVDTEHETIVKTRVMAGSQQLCRVDRECPPAAFAINNDALERLVRPILAQCDAVILSDYAKGLVTNQTIRWVRQAANCLVALDPKPRPGLDFKDIDIMTPNRNESLLLAGIEHQRGTPFPAEQVCERIWQRFSPRNLVVTLGAGGMLLCKEGKIIKQVATVARDVFDVSGAGDTVIAAITAAMAAGATLEEAAHYANAAAGVVVGKVGTATASPQEIEAFLEAEEDTQ